ncbi:helix-turn-helix transcriptional regulator [Sphingomonas colocasiae]|uniref:helix-turn-helix domain-containing protein n=1 Tax=Sphingomonas colocasiae TaxID=1848973 RepID=UPI0031BB0FA6
MALGQTIRQLRKAQELTQEELAFRSGLHVNYIGGIERGERNVGVKALFSLARGLDVQPSELFSSVTE